MKKICEYCHTPFKGRKERPRKCYDAVFSKAKPIVKVCALPGCGNTFEDVASPFPSKPQGQIYCSRACRDKARHLKFCHPSIEKTCEACHKKFAVPYKLRHRRFCSYGCFKTTVHNPARKQDRYPSYGADWHKQREKARQRDGYTCQVCGKVPENHASLQCHHIAPFRGIVHYKESNQLSNLITLCMSCHRFVHWGKVACPIPG